MSNSIEAEHNRCSESEIDGKSRQRRKIKANGFKGRETKKILKSSNTVTMLIIGMLPHSAAASLHQPTAAAHLTHAPLIACIFVLGSVCRHAVGSHMFTGT